MSSNKSWAQIAGKKTVKKASAKPADPAPMLDVPCPRCKHKNHTVVLDDISDEERRPGCTECDACFPPTGTGMASSAGTQPAIYRKRKIPPHIVVVSSGASLPGAGFKLEESSTEHHPPDDPNADIKPPLEISPMLRECPSVPPAYDDTSAEDHISSPTSRIQPDMGSADFPNVVFFRDLKQKSRVAISAELFEGSAPDDGPCNGGLQPPIGSKKSTEPQTDDQVRQSEVNVVPVASEARRTHLRDTPTFAQDFVRSLQHPAEPSIFHEFEEDLVREREARIRER